MARRTFPVYQMGIYFVNRHIGVSPFYTKERRTFWMVFRIAFFKMLCYIIVRKGDTNVQVKPLPQF